MLNSVKPSSLSSQQMAQGAQGANGVFGCFSWLDQQGFVPEWCSQLPDMVHRFAESLAYTGKRVEKSDNPGAFEIGQPRCVLNRATQVR